MSERMSEERLADGSELAARLRKALADGENWQVRGLAGSAAAMLVHLEAERHSLGKLADETADRLDAIRAELAKAERERDSARADALEEAAKVADDRVEPMRLLGVKNKESSPIDSERCHARAIEANHIAAMIRYRKSALKPTPTPDNNDHINKTPDNAHEYD